MGRTLVWLLVSLAVTIGVTAVLWHLIGPYVFFGFLFLPFLFAFGRHRHGGEDEVLGERVCPVCGYQTRDPRDRYCPRDATRLS